MARRTVLRAQLARAWRNTITGAYTSHLINSERGLQVHFCVALLEEFRRSRLPRRLFIEPTILFRDSVRRSPDLLICNTTQIIGVVEFKYTPRAIPSFRKDLDTLTCVHGATGVVTIANERFRGEGKPRRYTVAADAVFCWAGVYSRIDPLRLPSRTVNRLGLSFLRLDALTRADAPPVVKPTRQEEPQPE